METKAPGAVKFGRVLFALALAGFGALTLLHGDFVAGRAPAWPSAWPGRPLWAWASGLFFLAAGLSVLSNAKARTAAIAVGCLIFAWAFLRHLPVLITEPGGAIFTATGKALALCGGAFALSGFLSLGRAGLGGFMILAGAQHFLYADFVARLVPAWIAGGIYWAYFTGVALVAGGMGLLVPATRRLAAGLSGAMIFSWVLLLHAPRALGAASLADLRNEWTALFEAVAFSGTAFMLSGPERDRD